MDEWTGSCDPAAAIVGAAASGADPIAVVTGPEDPRIAWVNRAFSDICRADPTDLEGQRLTPMLATLLGHPALNAARATRFDGTVTGRDGSVSHWEINAAPTTTGDGTCWVLTCRPPTVDRHLDELLRASEERFRALAERAPIGIFSSEVGLRLGYVNDRLAELVGVPAEQLLGTEWLSHFHADDRDAVTFGLQACLDGRPLDEPARLVTVDGEERWVNVRAVSVRTPGLPAAFLGTVEDVTDRRRYEELLAWQATHDALTGLPNRSRLIEDIAAALGDGAESVAVLFFDLDDFKPVNDTMGHAAGDRLLITVAERLVEAVRDDDKVFRFAGDEFVVLARNVPSDDEAVALANRLHRSVTRPASIDGKEVAVKCSVGIVRGLLDTEADDLLHDADVAMYQAKRAGKGQTAVFDARIRADRERRTRLTEGLAAAVAAGEVSVSYLPMVSAETGAVLAAEAVPAWSFEGADLSAEDLVDIAGAGGFLDALGNHVLRSACADFSRLKAAGRAPARVCVDVSTDQVLADGFVDQVARIALASQLASSELCLEIDERAYVDEELFLAARVEELRELGLTVTVDHVGAGRSSLALLAHVPADDLKVDVNALGEPSAATDAVLHAVVGLGRARGIRVAAIGVRTAEEVGRARRLGFEALQGPACRGPLSADALADSIRPAVER